MALSVALVCLVAAACSSDSDDSTPPAAATEAAAQPTEAATDATPSPASEPAQSPDEAVPDAAQEAEAGSVPSTEADLMRTFLRDSIYGGLVQETGVSESSAQCVVDNITDETADAYIEFVESGPSDEPPPVIVELFRIQNMCLTPEELELMGAFLDGDDEFAETTEFGSGPCPPADGSGPTLLDFNGPQPLCLDLSKQYTAVFDTTAGEMRIDLDTFNTPVTANNFAVLARFHYYDDTLLFRTDPSIGIIQGGSPHTNSPSDPGPGYTIPDEGSGFAYEAGQIVMARTSAPNSASAQFFFAVNENTSLLNSQGTYVVFGQMDDDSLAVAEAILASHVDQPGNPLGGGPEPPVTVNSVTIEEAG